MSGQRSPLEREFLELWESSAAKLKALCLSWTGQPDLAEEAMARSRVLALEKYPEHADRLRHPEAWMRRLTYNVCIDLHRERSRRREDSLDELEDTFGSLPFPAGGDDPETAYLCRERSRMLRRAIRNLPDRLRRTLELHVFQGLEYREIADQLCITEANVRKRMQHGREALKEGFSVYHRRHQPVAALSTRPEGTASSPSEAPADRRTLDFRVVPVAGREGWRDHSLQIWRSPVQESTPRRRRSLESYVEAHPGGWKRRLDLAYLELRDGNLGAAVEQLRVVVDKQPRRSDLWRLLAATLGVLGAREEALRAYAEARRRSRTGAERQRVRAAMLDLGGDFEGALAALREAAEAQPHEETLAADLARLELALGNPGRARPLLETLLARFPGDAEYLLWHHDALEALGRRDESDRSLEQALAAEEDHPPALARWLARWSGGAGAPASGTSGEPSEELVARRRRQLEERAPGWLDLAWSAARHGTEQAEESFEGWLENHPMVAEGRPRRLHWLLERGQWGEAGRLAATLPPRCPAVTAWEPRLAILPVLALDAVGEPEAATAARRLAEQVGEQGEPLALAAVVLARWARGGREGLEQARALAERARRADPDGVRPRLAAAWVALARRRPEAACELLEPLDSLPLGGSPEAVAALALTWVARSRAAPGAARSQADRKGGEAAWTEVLAALSRRDPRAARRWGGRPAGNVMELPPAAWLLPAPWSRRIFEIR